MCNLKKCHLVFFFAGEGQGVGTIDPPIILSVVP